MRRKPCAREVKSVEAVMSANLPSVSVGQRPRPAGTAIAPRGPASDAKNAILPGNSIGNPKVRARFAASVPIALQNLNGDQRDRSNLSARNSRPKAANRAQARSAKADPSGSRRGPSNLSARNSRPKAANRAEARSAKADPIGNQNRSARRRPLDREV